MLIKDFIHHYPRALFNDIPGSGRSLTTYPGHVLYITIDVKVPHMLCLVKCVVCFDSAVSDAVLFELSIGFSEPCEWLMQEELR